MFTWQKRFNHVDKRSENFQTTIYVQNVLRLRANVSQIFPGVSWYVVSIRKCSMDMMKSTGKDVFTKVAKEK